MAARFEKTATPGIYKRGERYYATWTINGRTKKKACRTMKDARAHKAKMQSLVNSGEYQEESKEKFASYAADWIERYQGNGRAGFREHTRDDYRRDLRWYAFPYFHDLMGRRLTAIAPKDVAQWIRWLCDEEEQGRRRYEERCRKAKDAGKPRPKGGPKPYRLTDATVRRIVSPVRACLSTARDEGLIRHNPVSGVKLPHRPQLHQGEENVKAKAFTKKELVLVMEMLSPSPHRLLFVFLRGTGLRWSEVAALQWGDLELDGSEPLVRIRRSLVRGQVGPLKSKYSRREVPLSPNLVDELRAERKRVAPDDGRLVFVNSIGGPLSYGNMLRRVLKPVAEEAGVPWAAFHTFRHTYASMLFDRGANVVQVQRRLGHHSPTFTQNTYIHLLSDSPGEALEFDDIGQAGSKATRRDRNGSDGAQPSIPQGELISPTVSDFA
jgi:integrase